MASAKGTYETYQDKRGEWRWRLKSTNGKIVGAACEGYKSKADCEANMKRGGKAKDVWDFYQDKRGEWRWRQKASNGKIVGAATEGYKAKKDAEANAKHMGYKG